MGKKDTEKLLQITIDFLEGLTEKQFQALIDGNAVIRLDAEEERAGYQQLKESLRKRSDVESVLHSHTKKELITFCKHHAVVIKSRDTKKLIIERITSYVNKEQPVKEHVDWSQTKEDLHTCRTLEEAKNLLANHKLLRLKKDLTAFAKSLGIYVNKRYTKQELLERIADSVVGARIRGKVIRQEE